MQEQRFIGAVDVTTSATTYVHVLEPSELANSNFQQIKQIFEITISVFFSMTLSNTKSLLVVVSISNN